MNIFSRFGMALNAGWQVWKDPYQRSMQTPMDYERRYGILWACATNELFNRVDSVLNAMVSPGNRIYDRTRMIYNPTSRLVAFYSTQVYPGVLSEDGKGLPDGIPIAIPFAEDTKPELRAAIAQIWSWSNWQAKKSLMVRYGAALGDVLVEVIDDLDRKKVYLEVQWPGRVKKLILDAAGNVKSYCLEYQTTDDQGKLYTFRKEMDGESFRYYRDDQLYAEIPNIYGFVPAVWIKHQDDGTDRGQPAIHDSLSKAIELNAIVSHVHDQIHKKIDSPFLIASSGRIVDLFKQELENGKNEEDDGDSIMMLKGPADTTVQSLTGDLNLADAGEHIMRLIGEIEADNPELTFYDKLRTMTQVTGPGAARMSGDVGLRLINAQAIYDEACKSLFRMAVAIAGYRASSNAWGSLSRQQAKFERFGLESYAAGELDMSIAPRPLITPTRLEEAQEDLAFWQAADAAVTAGAPLEVFLKEKGWPDEKILQLGQEKLAAIQRDQALASEDVVPQMAQ